MTAWGWLIFSGLCVASIAILNVIFRARSSYEERYWNYRKAQHREWEALADRDRRRSS